MTASTADAPTIAVARYCEGAGHASRMLAVANALQSAGYPVSFAGGGPGGAFGELQGYDEHVVTPVGAIEDFQRGAGLLDVIRYSLPAFLSRIRDWRQWFRETKPAFLVTDDIAAAIAARLNRRPYVYISHDPATFYTTRSERYGARIRNRIAHGGATAFLQPRVWSAGHRIPGATSIPPLAPLADDTEPAVDVLLVPSAYLDGYDELVTALTAAGRDVTEVGGPDWTVKPTLQSHIEAASLVVCSGYSTLMECAVAGTPCIILPTTSEQHGVARALEGVSGFAVAHDIDDVLTRHETVPAPKAQQNGTGHVVEAVEAALKDRS